MRVVAVTLPRVSWDSNSRPPWRFDWSCGFAALCCTQEFSHFSYHFSGGSAKSIFQNSLEMRYPGIEPGPHRWQRRILTTRPSRHRHMVTTILFWPYTSVGRIKSNRVPSEAKIKKFFYMGSHGRLNQIYPPHQPRVRFPARNRI